MLQLDVGTCLEAGADPVAWIRANPGRIRSIHCKDWSPDPGKGYKVLFGEGKADWKGIFQGGRKRRRSRVLPHRARGKPLPGTGDRAEVPAVISRDSRLKVK